MPKTLRVREDSKNSQRPTATRELQRRANPGRTQRAKLDGALPDCLYKR